MRALALLSLIVCGTLAAGAALAQQTSEKPVEKAAEKAAEKPAEKPPEKKAAQKPAAKRSAAPTAAAPAAAAPAAAATAAAGSTPAATPDTASTAAAPLAPAEAPAAIEPPPAAASTAAAPLPPGLVSEPPTAAADTPSPAVVEVPATQATLPTAESLLREVRATDIAIVFFALMVALFALRTSASTSRLHAAARGQAEDNQRAIEASAKAADAARRSADAAEQTLAAMRENSERQLRAYVTVRQFLQAPVKDDRQNVHGWLLQVAWQNTGATPTRGFRYWAMLREFERAVPDDFEFTPAGLKDFAGGELGPTATVNSPPLFISQQQIAKIQDGSRKILLLGQADYHDMMRDVKRETRFCVELVLVNDPAGASGSPFSFSYHPKHNTIT